ncbi:hypothetical protein [Leisingera daeponensis]|uniref:hypothetical protein n=1 Tax=Leisingera daeponensis TaxID=405746 RepID=UPI001C951534|nr:hypothetical protein [Leisingera daeponensis]MBY6055372.1 hypothetical protein [Leisingera daeponensis]
MIDWSKIWPGQGRKKAREDVRKENARSVKAVREKRLELHRALEELAAARAEQKGEA